MEHLRLPHNFKVWSTSQTFAVGAGLIVSGGIYWVADVHSAAAMFAVIGFGFLCLREPRA